MKPLVQLQWIEADMEIEENKTADKAVKEVIKLHSRIQVGTAWNHIKR